MDTRLANGTANPDRRGMLIAYKAVLLAGALWVGWFYFRELASLLLVLVLTVIVAIPLTAFTDRLERLRVPRVAGALAGMLLALALVAGAFAFILPRFADQFEGFIDAVPALVQQIQDLIGSDQSATGRQVQAYLRNLLDNPGELLAPIWSIGATVATVAVSIVLLVLTAVFIAVNPRPLVDGALRLVAPSRREQTRRIMARVRQDWIGWLRGSAFNMLATGTLTYVALSAIGLDYALVFAVFTGLLEFIPYFGPVIAAIPPIALALTVSPETALVVLALYVAVQQFEGNVLVPLVMARSVHLHPAVVAIGAVVMGQLFGFMGLLLAVPMISLAIVLVQELWVFPRERDDGGGADGGRPAYGGDGPAFRLVGDAAGTRRFDR